MVQLPAGRTRAFGEPLLVLLGVFFAIGVAVTLPSLGYPWFHDDLHLVRPYSPSEVASTLAGPWDPDGIETAGYRPLTTAFNAARAALLGDSVVAHRLLEIALVASFLAVVGRIAMNFGASPLEALFAGTLTLTRPDNWWNLAWIADAVHGAAALLLALAFWLLLAYAARPTFLRGAGVAALVAASLLVREEGIALVPVLPALLVLRVQAALAPQGPPKFKVQHDVGGAMRATVLLAAALALIALVVGAAHLAVISGAPPRLRWSGWAQHVRWLAGTGVPLPGIPNRELSAAFAGLCALAGVAASGRQWRRQLVPMCWAGIAVLGCAHGVLQPRQNLLLVPSAAFGVAVAMWAGAAVRVHRLLAWPLALAAVAVICVNTATSLVAQESVHPQSTEYLDYAELYDWERESAATLPPPRREQLEARLHAAGFTTRDTFDAGFPALVESLRREGHDRPRTDGGPFVPRIAFLLDGADRHRRYRHAPTGGAPGR